jgi:hypothetical protein
MIDPGEEGFVGHATGRAHTGPEQTRALESEMNVQMLLGGFGGHELVLIAVIVLLMVGVSRLMEHETNTARHARAR